MVTLRSLRSFLVPGSPPEALGTNALTAENREHRMAEGGTRGRGSKVDVSHIRS